MKRYIIYILFLLPLTLFAQGEGVKLLDEAVAKLVADYPLQMTFTASIFDADGSLQFVEEGSLKIDRKSDAAVERYLLHLDNVKVWCDGATLWSHMVPTDETYILSPDDESAKSLSPVHLMQLYKQGYMCNLQKEGGKNVVTLSPENDNSDFGKVEIVLNASTLRPEKIVVYVDADGYTELKISDYWPRCNFEERIFTYPAEDYPDAEIVDMR